jgi:Lon protease-like protein
MMEDILRTDKMFGVVMSDGKGQFCDVGTAVENIKQEIYRGNALIWLLLSGLGDNCRLS